MKNFDVIDDSVYFENSKALQSCQFYKFSRILNSNLGEKVIIGDWARITSSYLDGFNKIDRNSLVFHSTVGLYSYTGAFTVIMHSDIGKFCSISWGVSIGPADHDYSRISTHDFYYNDFYNIKPSKIDGYDRFADRTIIGNDVWIGTNVTIKNGIKIGHGAVIGANSVVTRDVEPYSIVAGVPAKVLKKRFSDEIINSLLELKWWDCSQDFISENFQIFNSHDIKTSIKKIEKLKR